MAWLRASRARPEAWSMWRRRLEGAEKEWPAAGGMETGKAVDVDAAMVNALDWFFARLRTHDQITKVRFWCDWGHYGVLFLADL